MIKNPNPDFFPLSLQGLGWNSSTQNPCFCLRGGLPEQDFLIDVGSLEAGDLLRFLDHREDGIPAMQDLLVRLFVQNGYHLEGLYLNEDPSGQLKARLTCTKEARTEIWDLRPSDGIVLSLRMNFPVFAQSTAFFKHSATIGIPLQPDVLC